MSELEIRYERDRQLAVVWATPKSGFGYVADEQPMPYIKYRCHDLTPRFGGEENLAPCQVDSLPLPFGKLLGPWPPPQVLFNAPRRRINIYWRNAFKSMCREDRLFYFVEQLSYRSEKNGFIGRCPIFIFERNFKLESSSVDVQDILHVRREVEFEYFLLCSFAVFEDPGSERGSSARDSRRVVAIPSLEPNFSHQISSSTGPARLFGHRLDRRRFNKGEKLAWNCRFEVL
jgi:hypothetical protein